MPVQHINLSDHEPYQFSTYVVDLNLTFDFLLFKKFHLIIKIYIRNGYTIICKTFNLARRPFFQCKKCNHDYDVKKGISLRSVCAIHYHHFTIPIYLPKPSGRNGTCQKIPHPFFSSLYFLEESLTSPMTLQPWSVFDLNDLL